AVGPDFCSACSSGAWAEAAAAEVVLVAEMVAAEDSAVSAAVVPAAAVLPVAGNSGRYSNRGIPGLKARPRAQNSALSTLSQHALGFGTVSRIKGLQQAKETGEQSR